MLLIRHPKVIFIILFTLIFYASIYIFQENEFMRFLVNTIFQIIAASISFIWLFQTYRAITGKQRYFWLLLCLGNLFSIFAQIYWFYYQIIMQEDIPYPSWADFFWLIQYSLSLFALIFKIKTINSSYSIVRFIFNIVIFMTIAITLSAHFLIKPILSIEVDSFWVVFVSLAYPIFTLGYLFATISLYYLSQHSVQKQVLSIIAFGFFIQIIVDSAYSYLSIHGNYVSGNFVDPLWALTLLIRGYAGLYAKQKWKESRRELNHTLSNKKRYNILPYISVLVLLLIVVFNNEGTLGTLYIGLFMVLLFIIARQLFILVENEKLIREFKFLTEELNSKNNELKKSEERYRDLIEISPDMILVHQNEKIVFINDAGVEMIGATQREEILGSPVLNFVTPDYNEIARQRLKQLLETNRKLPVQKYQVTRLDGSQITMESTTKTIKYMGKPATMVIARDISHRQELEQAIYQMAYHDSLTGLPNRNQFYGRFQSAISDQNVKKAAILFLDLDRFKLINDTLGHDFGDLLLKVVSERLKDCIRTEDCLARFGGDEFVLFLPDEDQEGASKTAKQILVRLNEPFHLNDYEMYITPSMGITLYPQDGKDIGILIKKADLALHNVKRIGKNNFQFYGNQSMEQTNEIFEMEKDLRKAIEREEFVLYYQLKLNIFSGKIIGVEALIRWKHPDKGLISPAQFIPLAEETGMINSIGEWVMRKACAQIKALQENGFPPTVVSVNLSLRQFFQPNLIQMVSQVLEDTGLYPEYLELEITESMMIDSHHALMIVRELKKLGVKISLDDFGTGYSSLHYLKKFPIDKLKIDQSFIRECLTDANDATIVKTIIVMAHQLKMEVIAEGVETKDQLIFLQQNLCNEAQGYLFSRPLPIEEIEKKYLEIEQIVNRLGVPQELRDQQWTKEDLRVAQQELQDTVRQQQGMTFKFKEQDGKFIHTLCDGELLYRMGFVPEQIIGKELHEFLPEEIADEKVGNYRKAWAGEHNVTYEGECNGIFYLASLRPIRRGGQVVEVIASCVDFTERKQIEESLRLSEAKYRLITENMSDLIGVMDENGVLQYASPSHKAVLGFSPQELEGTTISHLLHPEDMPHVQNNFMEMALSKKPSQVEFRHKHADGHWVYLEAQGTPVFGENGEIENMVIVARDITERKQAEEC